MQWSARKTSPPPPPPAPILGYSFLLFFPWGKADESSYLTGNFSSFLVQSFPRISVSRIRFEYGYEAFFFFSANFLMSSYFKHVGKVLVRIFYKFEEFCEKPTNGARQPLPLPPSNCSMVKNQTMKYMLFYKQRFFSAQTQSCLTFS